MIELSSAVRWNYTSMPHTGRCRIDGENIKLRVKLSAYTRLVPDVLHVETFIRDSLRVPTTAEELALRVSAAYPGFAITVKGWTRTHGVIEVGHG